MHRRGFGVFIVSIILKRYLKIISFIFADNTDLGQEKLRPLSLDIDEIAKDMQKFIDH